MSQPITTNSLEKEKFYNQQDKSTELPLKPKDRAKPMGKEEPSKVIINPSVHSQEKQSAGAPNVQPLGNTQENQPTAVTSQQGLSSLSNQAQVSAEHNLTKNLPPIPTNPNDAPEVADFVNKISVIQEEQEEIEDNNASTDSKS